VQVLKKEGFKECCFYHFKKKTKIDYILFFTYVTKNRFLNKRIENEKNILGYVWYDVCCGIGPGHF